MGQHISLCRNTHCVGYCQKGYLSAILEYLNIFRKEILRVFFLSEFCIRNLEIRQKEESRSFQCHLKALFNKSTPGLSKYLGQCTCLSCYLLMIKGPASMKLHVILRYLSGKDANNFQVVEKIMERLLLYCFL